MKGLKLDSRVEGIAKRYQGWDGIIIDIIQEGKKKLYKVRWTNGREILHAAQALKLWGAPVVVRGPNLEQAAFRAVPIAAPRAVDNWEYNPEVDGDDDAGSVNTGSQDSRCSNFWR